MLRYQFLLEDVAYRECVPYAYSLTLLLAGDEAGKRLHNALSFFITVLLKALHDDDITHRTVFKNDDYNAIKKVYSIWICTKPSPDARGTCQRYTIGKEDFIGSYNVDSKHYDLMTVVVL